MSAELEFWKWREGEGKFVEGDEDGIRIGYVAGYDAGLLVAQQLAEADLSPCGHPVSRVNMDWSTMEFWCMDCRQMEELEPLPPPPESSRVF